MTHRKGKNVKFVLHSFLVIYRC